MLMLPLLVQGQQFGCPQTPVTCDVIVPTVSFGQISPTSLTRARLNVFTLTVTCRRTVETRLPIEILLQLEGLPARALRQALGPQDIAEYGLYLDPAQTQVWGDGSANTQPINDSFVLAPDQRTSTRVYSLYGTINLDPALRIGHYNGAVTVNLRYTLNCIPILRRALPPRP